MSRESVPPTQRDDGTETHPAWALIGASRGQSGPPGAVLFDSDIRHRNSIRIRISAASRRRDLNRDWIHAERLPFIEVELSEAQWASFISSMNVGDGVPATIRWRDGEVPGVPHEPRLRESMDEVRSAAAGAFEAVWSAFEQYEQKKNAANLRTLKYAIQNAPSNITFAGDSLNEHAENVVQRARADIEAMVVSKAAQLGIEAGDLGDVKVLGAGDGPDA